MSVVWSLGSKGRVAAFALSHNISEARCLGRWSSLVEHDCTTEEMMMLDVRLVLLDDAWFAHVNNMVFA